MTVIVQDQNSDYDGSGTPTTVTCSGGHTVSYSGTISITTAKVRSFIPKRTLRMFYRPDTNVDYNIILTLKELATKEVNLKVNGQYYFTLTGVNENDSLDVAIV